MDYTPQGPLSMKWIFGGDLELLFTWSCETKWPLESLFTMFNSQSISFAITPSRLQATRHWSCRSPGLANGLTKRETTQEDHLNLNQAASFQPNSDSFSIQTASRITRGTLKNEPGAQISPRSSAVRLPTGRACTSFLHESSPCDSSRTQKFQFSSAQLGPFLWLPGLERRLSSIRGSSRSWKEPRLWSSGFRCWLK